MPQATAAAEPPLDPAAVLSRFQGLRVGPKSGLSVGDFQPNSGVFVLPRMIAPPRLSRSTIGASSVGHCPTRDPRTARRADASRLRQILDSDGDAVERPRHAALGEPAVGLSAAARARSATTVTKALICRVHALDLIAGPLPSPLKGRASALGRRRRVRQRRGNRARPPSIASALQSDPSRISTCACPAPSWDAVTLVRPSNRG